MPISSDEWKEGRTQDTTETRILNFLRSNKDKAFTMNEIIENFYPSSPTENFKDRLRQLFEREWWAFWLTL